MNTQVNVRLGGKILNSARAYAEKHGFGTVQELIKETLREKVFGEELTKKELALVKKLAKVSEKKNLYGTEKELFRALERK